MRPMLTKRDLSPHSTIITAVKELGQGIGRAANLSELTVNCGAFRGAMSQLSAMTGAAASLVVSS